MSASEQLKDVVGMKLNFKKLLISALLIASSSLAVAETRSVNAVLFGYIPDAGHDQYAALKSELKKRFETQHPDIQLNITLDSAVDLYDGCN